MIAFLEPLSRLPGVDFVLLLSHDGVPIAHVGSPGGSGREESLAALTAGWLNDLSMAVAPLTWNAPGRVCLRGARGSVVLKRSDSACLLVVLARETSPEDVRLSMDGALARIERAKHGRDSAGETGQRPRSDATTTHPEPGLAGPIPYRPPPSHVEEGLRPSSHPGQAPRN